jgi:hypothetical protein
LVRKQTWRISINQQTTNKEELRLGFQIASKGGGDTRVQIGVPPGDFPTLIEAMCIVDRQAALLAMAQELSRQVALQPEIDQKNHDAGVDEVARRIRAKYWNIWNNGQKDNVIYQAVRKVVHDVKKKSE